MSEVFRRPTVNRALVEAYRYLAREAGLRVADGFFANAEATFARLARMPGLGTRYQPEEPLYADLRYSPVTRFRSYLVFYRPPPDGIEVFRVLHGARDLQGIPAEEFGIKESDANSDDD